MDIVNADDLDWDETDRSDDIGWKRKSFSPATDGEDLGASIYELPPGKRAWPYHFHTGNEEAIYVLGGSGTLRHDGETYPLEAGDYVSLPAGEAGGHRVVNDSEAPLRYLIVSTMVDPDVSIYPDSGKIGVFAGAAPGGDSDERLVPPYYREADAVDYWEGEE